MIELEVPKDIRKYEAKLFGPFTTRQLICFVIACAVAFGVYTFLKDFIVQDILIMLILVIDLPVLLCGWFKPYGMAFEQFAKVAFTTTFVSPSVRKYVTENAFSDKETQDKQAKINEKKNEKKQIKSKDPELVAYK
jgi:hypothetical protein